jgi:hypothetical protein
MRITSQLPPQISEGCKLNLEIVEGTSFCGRNIVHSDLRILEEIVVLRVP